MKLINLSKELNIDIKKLEEVITDLNLLMDKKKARVSRKTADAVKEYLILRKEKKEEEKKEKKPIFIPDTITVKGLAEAMEVPGAEVIKELIKNGIYATINQELDREIATIIAEDLGLKVSTQKRKEIKKKRQVPSSTTMKKEKRPPVVCIMGHVDHGKTTLLDTIRKSHLTEKEPGEITQHINGYQITWGKKRQKATFIDTPGHEAFFSMRERGAKVGDIAVIVVDAAEGVKEQTKEAVTHAKKVGIPIIVALNKIDLPNARPKKVKKELQKLDLTPEEWGGHTPVLSISAKTGQGIEDLLEMIFLVSDTEELYADKEGPSQGFILESHLDKGLGPVVKVIIREWTLRLNDPIIAYDAFGKVKTLLNSDGEKIDKAPPSTPVIISGFSKVPKVGSTIKVVGDLNKAKDEASKAVQKRKLEDKKTREVVSKDKDKIPTFNIILKASNEGSLDALVQALKSIQHEEVKLKILARGIGDINGNDIRLSQSFSAIIFGFQVKISPQAEKLAKAFHIKIKLFSVIYKLIEEVKKDFSLLLSPEIKETALGKVKVLAIFKSEKDYMIVGGKVTKGNVQNRKKAHILRNKEKIGEGRIVQLQQDKEDAESVKEGSECGLKIETETKILLEDVIEIYQEEIIERSL